MKKIIIALMMILSIGVVIITDKTKEVVAETYSFYIYRQDNPSQVNDITVPSLESGGKVVRYCLGGSNETFTVDALVDGGNFGSRGYNGQCWSIDWHDIGMVYNFSVKNATILPLTVKVEQVITPPVAEEPKTEEQTQPSVSNPNTSVENNNNQTNKDNSSTTTDIPVNNIEEETDKQVIELLKPEISEEDEYITITNLNEVGIIQYSLDNNDWEVYENKLLIDDLLKEIELESIILYARVIEEENISEINSYEIETTLVEEDITDEKEPTNDYTPFIIGGIGGILAVGSYYLYKRKNDKNNL